MNLAAKNKHSLPTRKNKQTKKADMHLMIASHSAPLLSYNATGYAWKHQSGLILVLLTSEVYIYTFLILTGISSGSSQFEQAEADGDDKSLTC